MSSVTRKNRILFIYDRLEQGKVINVKFEAQKFNVSERTIRRDLDDIKAFCSDRVINNISYITVEYDKERNGYYMTNV